MAYTNPSVADFKAYFFRDFPYGTDPERNVLDADITKAFVLANTFDVNQSFFNSQDSWNAGYLNLAAHFMVMNITASTQGMNGAFTWLEQSKSVGSVNQSFAIPQYIMDNPTWALLTKTNYGAQFLQMILPQLTASGLFVVGSTRP